MDMFDQKAVLPRPITKLYSLFNSKEHIYELELDGIRCIAYLDAGYTELRSQTNESLLTYFPELSNLHLNVNEKCILDGEIIIYKNGKYDHAALNHRLQKKESSCTASFIATDILYYKNVDITPLALYERKVILENVINESLQLSLSNYSSNTYGEMYSIAVSQNFPRMIAKKKDNSYYEEYDPNDWIYLNATSTESYTICGYRFSSNNTATLVLGNIKNNLLVYKKTLECIISPTLADQFHSIERNTPALNFIPSNLLHLFTWLQPKLTCNVETKLGKSTIVPSSIKEV